jgi:acyl-CoA thioesterase-1
LLLIWACSSSNNQTEKPGKSNLEPSNDSSFVKEQKTIIFFGNSITAGYQLEMEVAFPAVIQGWIDSLGLEYNVVNAGLSGETSASGTNRIDWVLNTNPDVFVLELGGNDGLRGLPLSETYKNLQAIIDAVKAANPEVILVIAGMQVPPNLGQEYTQTFRDLYPKLAESNDAFLIPFLLEGVAGDPALNLDDGIHPTAEGHQIIAQTVWEKIYPLIKKEPEA